MRQNLSKKEKANFSGKMRTTLTKYTNIIKKFMSVPQNNPDLLIAQYKAFSKQIPLMYFILLVNTWALSYSFIKIAPIWLTIYIPGLFSIICISRLIYWWRAIYKTPTVSSAYQALNRTNNITGVITLIFSFWSVSLFPYGGAYEQAHIAFYMAITVIGVISCLMHLRSAALTVTLIVNGTFVGFFSLSEMPTFSSIAVNVLLVSIAMLSIMLVNYRDFTNMVAARVENFRLANLDALTQLPNRRHFFSRLKADFENTRATSTWLTVGLLDLDGFKPVNDLYGHAIGDELLKMVGQRLNHECHDRAYVARLGGDEFAIIARHTSNDTALELGEEICKALREPYNIHGVIIEVSATIGFAIYPQLQTKNETDLFERADYALYQGKRLGRDGAVLFSARHHAEIQRNINIEKALRSADLANELLVFFQPIVNINSEKPVAFEALARWRSPEIGEVSPALFIPVAERAGIVPRLTAILLRQSLEQAKLWPEDIRLSFNLSAKDITNRNGADGLIGIITASGFDPKRIDFEITETSMMHEYEYALKTLNSLRAIGCGISLDDFGTGYSSLSQLHSLPLTKIKIDRSFVIDLHRNPAGYKIVKSLIVLSHDMDLECIVEGVETTEEIQALKMIGCSFVQGFYFSKPLSKQSVINLLSKNNSKTDVSEVIM